MNIATVQLIMSGLGLTTGLLIALFAPGRAWFRWVLGIATGTGIAITGWPTLWLTESAPELQLYKSLILAAVVVLIALVTIMLLYPSRRAKLRNEEANTGVTASTASDVAAPSSHEHTSPESVLAEFSEPQEPGRDAIDLQLEKSPDAMIANQDEHALMHLLASGKRSTPSEVASIDAANEIEQDTNPSDKADDVSEPLLVEVTSNKTPIDQTIEKEIDKPATNGDNASTADVVSLADRRVQREGEVAADALDLSDSEELYQAMRDAEADLELPEDSTWLEDEGKTQLESAPLDHQTGTELQQAMDAEIEDAEILAINDALDTDATTADLPITEDYEINTDTADIDFGASEPSIDLGKSEINPAEPASTLEGALTAQRQSIAQLSSDTDTLADRLSEWRKLSDGQEQNAWQASLRQGQTVQHQQQRILAENNFRQAAVGLIRTQRDVMRQLMTQIGSLGEQREEDLASLTALQETSINQQRLARQAALLARKAAADKQTIMTTLRQEQTAHARTKSAAKRAMDIARDAVDKLAIHERRLGLSNNRQNPDSKG